MKSPLLNFRSNKYSQNGEDGIVAELLKRLELDQPGWVCEFGAWDGKHLSNTFALVERGWNAVYIEGDSEKVKDLQDTAKKFPNIIPIEKYIPREGGLDNILNDTPIPCDFTLLSIDIDSYDLDIWEGLKKYRPLIVIIEINSSIEPGIMHRHTEIQAGNSFSSTIDVAIKKGYTAVCHTGNMIFVRDDCFDRLQLPADLKSSPEILFLDSWVPDSRSLFVKFSSRVLRGLKNLKK